RMNSFHPHYEQEIEQKLEQARNAFQVYRRMPMAERARMMKRAADILDDEKEIFGWLITTETGKTFRAAIEECGKCAWACRYFADNAERGLADEVVETGGARAFIHYEPLGPV